MAQEEIFVAKESFVVNLDGEQVSVVGGATRVRKGHALMKGREHLFAPIHVDYDVEQATARPGEQRGAPTPVSDVIATSAGYKPAPASKPAPEPVPAKTEVKEEVPETPATTEKKTK